MYHVRLFFSLIYRIKFLALPQVLKTSHLILRVVLMVVLLVWRHIRLSVAVLSKFLSIYLSFVPPS